ncbi:hypothetical protein NB537_15770 [Vibrio parahaemolyticus]|nr:hypothetical protein [Vibrio parahaemolyticus]MCR9656240.1 hypothetical protein [Vibrio parahaemolyticus]
MEDDEIKRAVEGIMNLRPEPKLPRESLGHRAMTKQRHDEWLFARELEQIDAGEVVGEPLRLSEGKVKKSELTNAGRLTFRKTTKRHCCDAQ